MNYKEPIMQFFGVTRDNEIYHFFIDSDDKKIYCCEFGLDYAGSIIEIKPNFVLRNSNYETVYNLKEYLRENPSKIITKNYQEGIIKPQTKLIQNYIIEPSILKYLIDNTMIMYSHDMALLYNLDTNYSYDKHQKNNAFKRQRRDKTKILIKQKQGIFN